MKAGRDDGGRDRVARNSRVVVCLGIDGYLLSWVLRRNSLRMLNRRVGAKLCGVSVLAVAAQKISLEVDVAGATACSA